MYALHSMFLLKPPVTDNEKVAFDKLAGEDGEIDAFELQKILNEEFMKGNYCVAVCCWLVRSLCDLLSSSCNSLSRLVSNNFQSLVRSSISYSVSPIFFSVRC